MAGLTAVCAPGSACSTSSGLKTLIPEAERPRTEPDIEPEREGEGTPPTDPPRPRSEASAVSSFAPGEPDASVSASEIPEPEPCEGLESASDNGKPESDCARPMPVPEPALAAP